MTEVRTPDAKIRTHGIRGASLIATMSGEKRADSLKVGDSIFTRDNGAQNIRRIERIAHPEGARTAVRVAAGALGHGLPEQDMIVMAEHRILICSERAHLLLDDTEVLVNAADLVGQPGFTWAESPEDGFVAIYLDFHEVALCDGAWTETAMPHRVVHGYGAPARRVLRRFEAQLIAGS